RVDGDLVGAEGARRHERADPVDGTVADGGAARSAEQREDQALGEHLAEETSAAGADGGADGQLALAVGAASERQVRDVGAGEEEDECYGAQQNLHVLAAVA